MTQHSEPLTPVEPLLPHIDSPADVRALSREQLGQLSDELREFILHSVAQTGGHLSSNLGTVELTVALHHVFNTPTDKIVWDVGRADLFSWAYFSRFFMVWVCVGSHWHHA